MADNLLLPGKEYKEGDAPGELLSELDYQFVQAFGINSVTKDIIRLKVQIEVCEIRVALGQVIMKNQIKVLQKKLERLLSMNSSSPRESKFFVSKEMGYHLNTKEITVYDYYSYVKQIEKMHNNP